MADDSAAPPAAADAAKKAKRGRKTQAELQKMDQQLEQNLAELAGSSKGMSPWQTEGQYASLPPAEGPGSWAEAAAAGTGEDDRRRFPYHRCVHLVDVQGCLHHVVVHQTP